MSGFLNRVRDRWLPRKKIEFAILVVIERDEDRFHAFCPALKGLHADGTTIEEAVQSALSLAILYVQSLVDHRDPIPLGLSMCSEHDQPEIPRYLPDNCQTKRLEVVLA